MFLIAECVSNQVVPRNRIVDGAAGNSGWLQLAVPSSPMPVPLTIYWVDVEGGGTSLIVTPAGQSILIDTGERIPPISSSSFRFTRRFAGGR